LLSLPVLTGTIMDEITILKRVITAIVAITNMGNHVITPHTDMAGTIMDRMPPAGIVTGHTDMAGIIMADSRRKKSCQYFTAGRNVTFYR